MRFESLKPLSANLIQELWPHLTKEIRGDGALTFSSVTSPEQADEGDVVFAHQEKVLKTLLARPLGLLVTSIKLEPVASGLKTKATIISSQPDVLMALILNTFFQKTPHIPTTHSGIHPSAVIHPTAKVDPSATVAPFAVLGIGVTVGPGCYIGPHSTLEAGSQLGSDVVLHSSVYIGPNSILGDRVEIHANSVLGKEGFGYAATDKGEQIRIPHLGRVIIKDDVHIGALCSIDRGTLGDTVIGQGTKIDNQCHIGHNGRIGKHSVITAHFAMAGSSQVGDHFVCGGKTVVGGHLKVTDRVQVAALSAISKDISQSGAYGGYPLQPIKEFLKTKALSPHLPQIKKDVSAIKKKLGI